MPDLPKKQPAQSTRHLPFTLFRFTTGNPGFSGRTVVEIKGSGQVRVEFAQGEEMASYAGKLSSDKQFWLAQELSNHEPSKIAQTNRSPVAGEEKIILEFGRGTNLWTGAYWTNDQTERPALRRLVEFFEASASEISRGKVRF